MQDSSADSGKDNNPDLTEESESKDETTTTTKKRKGMLSRFKSLKEEDLKDLGGLVSKKGKSLLETGSKKKKRRDSKSLTKSSSEVQEYLVAPKRNGAHSFNDKDLTAENFPIRRTKSTAQSKPNTELDDEMDFKYDFVETKDDSFLGDSPTSSTSTSRSNSRANSKDELHTEASEETAANRRAKFLQRYGSISPDTSRDDVNLPKDSTDDPHAKIIAGSNKKFHKRFKLPEEKVIEDFLCALLLRGALLAQGSMYITQNYVCFYANIFGKKTRVTVPFREIISVRKCKILRSIPNSIEIHTMDKKYFWASFLHREDAFQLIDQRWRLIRKKMGSPIVDEVRPLEESESFIEWGVDEKGDLGYDWRATDSMDSFSSLNVDEEHDNDSFPPLSPICCHQVERSETAIKTAPNYTEKFPISVQDFYLNFLSDGSDTFWKEFHSRDGYTAFSMTPWCPSLEGCCLERQTNFKAPIRMSLASKHTRVTQRQRCRFVSADEIMFETSSHSRDVPYSNQFLVDALWKITNLEDGSGCQLSISVFVRFTKKNWLKSMIERNAIEGSRDWFENWIYSALAVANHIKRNSSIPHSLRTSTTEILKSSVNHVHSQRAPTEKIENVSTARSFTFMSRSMKVLLVFLILVVFGLLYLTVSYYSRCQALNQELDFAIQENQRLGGEYLHMRTAISLITSGAEHSVEQIQDHWNLWKTTNELDSKLEEWRSHLHRLEEIIHTLSRDVEGFSLSAGDSNDPAFYESIAAALHQKQEHF